ncbi:MAG: tetratricopeptide repeat protein, partial [Thermoplasmatales archaeon]|nr:tetratricopeptide repeat protein [Thermoplasmatales archaeon]
GIGKTALLSKIIEEYKGGKNIFYYNIHEWDTLRSILESFSDFLQRMGERKLRYYLKSKPDITMSDVGILLEEELKNIKNAMIIFDDTQKANNEIIHLFEFLREILPKTDTNLILAGRKKLGFYDARHILHSVVGEMKLDGLDKNSSRKLVDEKIYEINFRVDATEFQQEFLAFSEKPKAFPENGKSYFPYNEKTKLKGLDKNSSEKLAGKKMLDEDVFEKIYSFTKGHPMALELISTDKGLEKTRDVMKYVYNEVFRKLIPQEKELMFFVSVFNRPVPVDMLLQNNFSYENVQELIKKSLLIENGTEMVHPHDLLREFFYNKSPAELKIRNHKKAAEYYENGKEELDIIAAMHHYLKADDQKQAVKLIVKNGEKLINKGFGKEFMEVTKDIDENMITQKSDWVEILLFKGKIWAWAGEWDKSLKLNEKALKLSEETGNKNQIAKSELNIGRTQINRGEYKKALKSFEKALQTSKDIGDMAGLNEAYYQIGKVCWRMGNLNDATMYLNLALKSDDQRLAGKALIDIGVVYYLRGEFEESIKMWMKALEIFQSLKDMYEIVRIYNNIGNSYVQNNKLDKAVEYYEKHVRLAGKIGWIGETAIGLHNLSYAYLKKGDIGKSRGYVEKSLHISKKMGNKYGLANCYSTLGAIFRTQKNYEKSIENYNKAIKTGREIGNTEVLSHTYLGFAKMFKQKGDKVKAKTQFQNSLKYYEKLGDKEKIKEIEKELAGIEKKG